MLVIEMTLLITMRNILTYSDVNKQDYHKVKCFYSLLYDTLIDIYKNSVIKIFYKWYIKESQLYFSIEFQQYYRT